MPGQRAYNNRGSGCITIETLVSLAEPEFSVKAVKDSLCVGVLGAMNTIFVVTALQSFGATLKGDPLHQPAQQYVEENLQPYVGVSMIEASYRAANLLVNGSPRIMGMVVGMMAADTVDGVIDGA